MKIPLCPLPIEKAKIVSKKFHGIAQFISKISPNTEMQLKQAEMDITVIEFLSIAVFSSFFIFVSMFATFFLISIRTSTFMEALTFSFPIGVIFFLMALIYIKSYPKVIIAKKIKDIERNLLYALKHLYVQIKSGVPIFDALSSVAQSNYGMISSEFREVVKRISVGVPTEIALDNSARKIPSQHYRRVIWQLSNGIKAGSDIGHVIESTIENIATEQKIMIKKYGAQLNPLTLVYMMFAVIIPSLGVTFMIVLSSFSGINLSENTFWGILIFVFVFQFMFVGIVKSKRPNIL